jgi:hypothetical protein
MSTRAFLVAKAERDLKAAREGDADQKTKKKHDHEAAKWAAAGASGAMIAPIVARGALGGFAGAAGHWLFPLRRKVTPAATKAAAEQAARATAKPRPDFIIPPARRVRTRA